MMFMTPSAICIGAQKAGTTALYEYLKLHPGVSATEIKEIDFFNCNSRYAAGLETYYRNFPRRDIRSVGKITLDVTPGYLGAAEIAAARIAAFNPHVRIIALLRNPIDRAHSAWQMYRRFCESNRNWFFDWVRNCDATGASARFVPRSSQFGQNFAKDIMEEMAAEDAEKKIEMPILALGDYARHLVHYYEHFGREQILIVWSEDFRRDTPRIMRRIEEFLDLIPYAWKQDALTPRFAGEYEDRPLSQVAHTCLRNYYATRNETLFRLVHDRPSWP